MNDSDDPESAVWEERLRAWSQEYPEGLGDRVMARVEGELAHGSGNRTLPSLAWMIAGLAWLHLSLGIVQLAEWRPLVVVDDHGPMRKSTDTISSLIDADMKRFLEAWL